MCEWCVMCEFVYVSGVCEFVCVSGVCVCVYHQILCRAPVSCPLQMTCRTLKDSKTQLLLL